MLITLLLSLSWSCANASLYISFLMLSPSVLNFRYGWRLRAWKYSLRSVVSVFDVVIAIGFCVQNDGSVFMWILRSFSWWLSSLSDAWCRWCCWARPFWCASSWRSWGWIAAKTVTGPPSGIWLGKISPSCGEYATVNTVVPCCCSPWIGICICPIWNFGACWTGFGLRTWIWNVCVASPGFDGGIVIGSVMYVCVGFNVVAGDVICGCVWRNCTFPSLPETKLST